MPAALALWCALSLAVGAKQDRPQSPDLEESVRLGRQALGNRWRYPWYDGQTDGIRRIPAKTPMDLPDWNMSPGRMNLSWMQVLVWVGGALLLALLAYLMIRAYLNRENRLGAAGSTSRLGDRVGTDDAARVEALPFRIRRGASDLLGEARRYLEQGNYREAIIYLFSYQLVELDRHQLIRLIKGKTNRQYLREIGRRPKLRGLVEQTMVAFEDVFFGDYHLDRRRFQACWNQLDDFSQLVAEQVPA